MHTEVFRDNGLWSWLRFAYAQFMGDVSQPSDFCNKIDKEHGDGRVTLTVNSQSVVSVGSGTVTRKNTVSGGMKLFTKAEREHR